MHNNNRMIYPCPFSKRYGIPAKQAWLLLNIFFLYRIIIASLFSMLYFSHFGPSLLGSLDAELYDISALGYFIFSVIAGLSLFLRYPDYPVQAQLFIFADIVFITLLMHASGGITSGIGILLAVTTAAGGFLVGGRCAMVFAAIATFAIFSEQIYADLGLGLMTAYTHTGMLGASFFAIAFLSYFLALRTEQSESLALQQKQTISRLQELNHYIIQHLQSGILLVNQDQTIKMANESALRLLKITLLPDSLQDIAPQLAEAFEHWHTDSRHNSINLPLAEDTQIQVIFNRLPVKRESVNLIILEDEKLYKQRLQQGKLASLGRLTASIAHEIRNPLSAIHHAGQLLSESYNLDTRDKRLTEIIQTHCARVNKIINDILQLSRQSRSQRDNIELVSWLKNYRRQFLTENHLSEKQFILQTSAERINILFDQEHLKQILDNLCLNALKYGKATEDYILLRIVFDSTTHSHDIQIIDHGPGIKPDHAAHLFEPFFTTSTTGTGLGLYISNELAELNQAQLFYHPGQERGSCFSLIIPDAGNQMIAI